ncbi:unnamed protein product [Blepharisma stoltei]|uniref:Uncharacterized protein n=1 Tax=Blepharisma stoltei TaxID=1481888 RepID=A0AAU9JLP4_9CILI|nr:unnamed protein product [Blepharisma stoltei]
MEDNSNWKRKAPEEVSPAKLLRAQTSENDQSTREKLEAIIKENQRLQTENDNLSRELAEKKRELEVLQREHSSDSMVIDEQVSELQIQYDIEVRKFKEEMIKMFDDFEPHIKV